MTDSTPTKTMRNSKLRSLASTSSRKHINFSSVRITFFTILRAAWLLHPSQVVHQAPSTKTTSLSPPSSTMARNETTQIPDNQSADKKKSKHRTISTGPSTRSNKAKAQNQLQSNEESVPMPPLPPSPSGQKNYLTRVLTSVASLPPFQGSYFKSTQIFV